jgi:hypothetical protein
MHWLRAKISGYTLFSFLSIIALIIIVIIFGPARPPLPLTPPDIPETPLPVSNPPPTPEATPTRTPPPAVVPTSTPLPVTPLAVTPTPSLRATPTPDPSPAATVTPVPLTVTLLSPVEGTGIEIGAVRVLGLTLPDAIVTVNGVTVEVSPDGGFQHDLLLKEGINSIEAVATDQSGQLATENVVVLFIPSAAGVPLSVLFPQGLEVREPNITVIGATRQDAVVGVNRVPVEVNNLGIFSTTVPLEEGVNLIEVVAIDLQDNVNFQTVVVFYIP